MLLPNQNKKAKTKRISVYVGSLFIITIFHLFFFSSEEITNLKKKRVELGNERFIKAFPSELQGKRLGLVINHTSVLPQGESLIEGLLEKGRHIQAVFSPEHGFSGTVEEGIQVKDSRLENITIYSLYGRKKRPSLEQTRDVDVFVYDIQDIGTRFYTYITTLKYILEASAEAEKPVYVLDRPNPTGGLIIEGPLLDPAYESFIGALPIPIRYGLTPGELALMMRGEGWVSEDINLHVIKMKNWKREYFWKDSGLSWIPTSPNIPSPETAIIYPGTGLLGALNLNPGLGTSRPFLQFGAPWLKPISLIGSLSQEIDFGIELEAVNYTPRSLPGKTLHPSYENKICRGIYVRILEEEKFLSLRFTLNLIKVLKEQYQDEILPNSSSLNLMFGNDMLFRYLTGKITYKKLIAEMEKDEKLFRKKRLKYLLYK